MNKKEFLVEYKQISADSEKLLQNGLQLLGEIDVKGQNVFNMGNAVTMFREILKQINSPVEEGDSEKEE